MVSQGHVSASVAAAPDGQIRGQPAHRTNGCASNPLADARVCCGRQQRERNSWHSEVSSAGTGGPSSEARTALASEASAVGPGGPAAVQGGLPVAISSTAQPKLQTSDRLPGRLPRKTSGDVHACELVKVPAACQDSPKSASFGVMSRSTKMLAQRMLPCTTFGLWECRYRKPSRTLRAVSVRRTPERAPNCCSTSSKEPPAMNSVKTQNVPRAAAQPR
mmetsp:Transcript_29841/g.86651  ORF Transcript_29841/g.86651 Transcript_29841/m.86651 type:complete len:219 (+) Transcript_29841:226-882(+)